MPEYYEIKIKSRLDHRQPEPSKLWFIPWIMRLLALIPLLQIASVAATLQQARRWRSDPAARPGWAKLMGQHILPPLIAYLSLAAIPLFFRSRGRPGYLRLCMPDVYWAALLSGGFAGLWAILRAGLVM